MKKVEDDMDCQKCKSLISEYLEENLDNSMKQHFEEHIAGCPECEKELNDLLDSWQILDDYMVPKVSENFTQKVTYKIHEHSKAHDSTPENLWGKIVEAFTLKNVAFLPALGSLIILAAIGYAILKGGSIGINHQPEISNTQKVQIVRDIKDEDIIRDLEVYQNVEMLENLDVLEDLETLENMEEEE
ncbi:MAG: zf-HC2 domain-containing protein [Candidatus Riflebacteria bacterium]